MLTHADIWSGIDRLAEEHHLTASGLARRAGLDPTAFNRSKRTTRDGKERWPSTESVAKILHATGSDLRHFVDLVVSDPIAPAAWMPLALLRGLRLRASFDAAGVPVGDAWREFRLPEVADPRVFALAVAGSELEPVYRDGAILIISGAARPRRGDRIFVSMVNGDVSLGYLLRRSAKRLDVRPLPSNAGNTSLRLEDVAVLGRIMWATQ